MEVKRESDAHYALLSSISDPYLLILATYLTVVVAKLTWLSRSAIKGDSSSIPIKGNTVKKRIAMAFISLAATWF